MHRLIYRNFIQRPILRSFSKMQTAFVYMEEGEEHLKLSFPYRDDLINKKELQFRRPLNEPLENTFNRIMLKIVGFHERKHKRKKKKSQETVESGEIGSLPMKILCQGSEIPKNTLNSDAWKCNSIFILGDSQYKVNINPPTVLSLKLPTEIMAGFPVIPYAQLQHANLANSSFVWYKSEKCVEESQQSQKGSCKAQADCSHVKWIPIATGYAYNVENNDVGHCLRVICYPKLKDQELECVSDEAIAKNPVGAGPDACPYHVRHTFTKEKCSDTSFRILSYNILANCYADSDYSREHLFSFCPPYALAWDYRRQLLLDEIKGYNGDIICMQEVDEKAFYHDFEFYFKSYGLKGLFDLKGEEMHEGLACFYNQEKFKLLNRYAVNLAKEVQKNENMVDICEKVKQNENLAQRFLDRKNIVQVAEFEYVDGNHKKRLIVANTHLYFHPDADHIRLLQGTVIVKFIEEFLTLKRLKHPDYEYSLVICGDFNSCPEFGIYQLMMSQHIPEDYADWKSCPEEEVKNLSVSHTLNLESTYGRPQYTNYTLLFNGCLDYIFFERTNLKLLKNAPLPSHDEVTLYEAIPNITFPSDHLCLISDLEWK